MYSLNKLSKAIYLILNNSLNHGITKYGIHSLMQITLAMDKELTNRQDSLLIGWAKVADN